MEKLPLYPGTFYHIFNHAIGTDNLFKNQGNYTYFLKKYVLHILPIAHTFAYCLMPNHLHLIVRIKEVDVLNEYFLGNPGDEEVEDSSENGKWKGADMPTLCHKTSKQFGNLFSAYSQAFNKQQGRKGNLFISNFKRREIDSLNYLLHAIRYLHFNPVHHDFVARPEDWAFSSFATLLSNKPTHLLRDEVLSLFGGKEAFLAFHQKPPDWSVTPEFFDF